MNEILSSPADDSAALKPARKKAPAAKKTTARKTAAETTPPPAPAPPAPAPAPVAKAPAKKGARKKVEAVVESAPVPAPAPPVAAKKAVAKKAARKTAAAVDQGQLPLMLSEPAPVPAVAAPAVAVAEAPAPKKKVARKTARVIAQAEGPVSEGITPSPAPAPIPSASVPAEETASPAPENPRTRRLGRGFPQDERGRAPRQENQTRDEAQVPTEEAAPAPSPALAPQRLEGPPPRQEHGPRHDGPPRPDGPPRHHQGPQRPHDGPPRQDSENDPNVIIGPDGQPRRLNKWERWKQRKEKFKLLKQQRYLERQAGAPPRPGPGQGQGEGPHAEQQGPRRPDDQRPGGQGGPPQRERFQRPEYPPRPEPPPLGPPEPAAGLLEFSGKGIAFLRPADRGYAASPMDTFVSPELIRQFGLREGVIIEGLQRRGGRGPQLVEIKSVNGLDPNAYRTLPLFEELTAINPNKRYVLETSPNVHTTRLIDFIAPIGRGQRGLIVAPPRAGKTTFLQHIAEAVIANYESVKVIVLLVDERPEEVTELARALPGAEIMASSNDQDPRNHIRMAQLAVERAKRLVEAGEHVFMLLDSITRLARAFNNAMRGGGGKAMSGGIDSRALELPRKLFAAARNTREAGSLTIMATALVETNNKGDDLIFQEFKGTGNMELVLDRKISQQYVYPAVDIFKSGTRREELLLPPHQLEKVHLIRRGLAGHRPVEAVERLLHFMKRFPSNAQMLVEIKSRE